MDNTYNHEGLAKAGKSMLYQKLGEICKIIRNQSDQNQIKIRCTGNNIPYSATTELDRFLSNTDIKPTAFSSTAITDKDDASTNSKFRMFYHTMDFPVLNELHQAS